MVKGLTCFYGDNVILRRRGNSSSLKKRIYQKSEGTGQFLSFCLNQRRKN
uniref:Uncharacterized protein n=1 Tax=Escherichia coli TaxID=562 RepID=A0A7U1HRZ3_ECOLX|nr:hypothetical protein [Escherichia coli]